MKRFFRHIVAIALVVATLGLVGCNKSGEKREKPEEFEVISIDNIALATDGTLTLTATVANNTIYNVRFNSGSATIKSENRKIGAITLKEEVLMRRRSRSQIEIPLKITLSSSMAAISAVNNIRKGDLSKVTVDYSIVVKVMASKFTLEEKDISLEKLNQELDLGLKK